MNNSFIGALYFAVCYYSFNSPKAIIKEGCCDFYDYMGNIIRSLIDLHKVQIRHSKFIF